MTYHLRCAGIVGSGFFPSLWSSDAIFEILLKWVSNPITILIPITPEEEYENMTTLNLNMHILGSKVACRRILLIKPQDLYAFNSAFNYQEPVLNLA